MRNAFLPPALLPNLAGAHLPPVALSVSARYQFCVDAGSAAAMGFFNDVAALGLHDHIAGAMLAFTVSVLDPMLAAGDVLAAKTQAHIDAFAAGYLGRVQQELRLFHGEAVANARNVHCIAGTPSHQKMH